MSDELRKLEERLELARTVCFHELAARIQRQIDALKAKQNN